jgi:hypothetical protein
MSYEQNKITVSGETRQWTIDTAFLRSKVPWVREAPDRLDREILAMSEPGFDGLLLVFSDADGTYARLCPYCGDIIVPCQSDARCVSCHQTPDLRYHTDRIGFAGSVATQVGQLDDFGDTEGRPFLESLIQRTLDLPDGDRLKSWYHSYFLTRDNRIWFVPQLVAIFPDAWPEGSPDVYLRSTYFDLLAIPHAGIFETSGTHCRILEKVPGNQDLLAQILLDQVVPRFAIDLMMADLGAQDLLDDVLITLENELGIQDRQKILDSVYREGKTGASDPFTRLYRQFTSRT